METSTFNTKQITFMDGYTFRPKANNTNSNTNQKEKSK
jgi:hypothetical protein